MRRRSHASRAVRPSCPSSTASCIACAMCRRSVSSRSPRADRGCAAAPTPRATPPRTSLRRHGPRGPCPRCADEARSRRQSRRRRLEPGRVQADETAKRDTAYPGRAVRLLQRLEQPLPLGGRGCQKTLVFPVSTTGTPAARSCACTSCAWLSAHQHRDVAGLHVALAAVARLHAALPESSATTSPARSRATRSRAGRRACRSWSRSAARRAARPAAATAPPRRPSRPSCAASTGSTRIRSSPRAAPPKTAAIPSSSAVSLRWFVGRVRTTTR